MTTVLETLDATQAGAPETQEHSARPLSPGDTVGRYVVLAELGAGGMGVVYAAYDPELERRIALKLLHADRRGSQGSVGRARLVREAQAMAKLDHPNVVAVYDVGEHRGAIYVAMEFIAGTTFGAWLELEPRTWREVLAIMSQAGAGLSAAHVAGMVHRDFKPDNVMVGDDGRVRVLDFGLVRAGAGAGAGTGTGANTSASVSAADLLESREPSLGSGIELTIAGGLMGTPAYMAPEQFGGAEVDARSDQFSFCVSLWEALYRQRPFEGQNLASLALAVIEDQRREPPTGSGVPPWLRRVVERGLAHEPEHRFASMDALLDALASGQRRVNTRRAAAVVAGMLAVGVGVLGYQRWDRNQRIEACVAEGAAIHEVWNQEADDRLHAAFAATGLGYAETTADKTSPWFERQASAWETAATTACTRATVDRVWDDDTLDRARWCLDDRRMEMELLIQTLSEAKDATTLSKAVPAAAGLAAIDPCLDPRALGSRPPPPRERRDEIRAVRRLLVAADGLRAAGRADDGVAIAREARASAETLGWEPLIAAASLRAGQLANDKAEYEDAEQALTDAYFRAVKAGDTELGFVAAAELVYAVGYKQARHREGRGWAAHAEVAELATVDEAKLRRATRLNNLGLVENSAAEYGRAKQYMREAIGLREAALGANHPIVGTSYNNLGIILSAAGEYDEARALYQRALVIWEEVLGPEHPMVAQSYNNLAIIEHTAGDPERAQVLYEKAIAVLEAALGPNHPDVAASVGNLAQLHYARGRYDEAAVLLERALAIRVAAFGEDHPSVAESVNALGGLRYSLGEFDAAKQLFARSLAICERTLDPDHPDIAKSLNNLAAIQLATGELESAKASFERAASLTEASLGPEHPQLAATLANLGAVHNMMGDHAGAKPQFERSISIIEAAAGVEHQTLIDPLAGLADSELALGEREQALAHARRALAIGQAAGVSEALLAEARFVVARGLLVRDRAAAVGMAKLAADGVRESPGREQTLADIEAWLAAL